MDTTNNAPPTYPSGSASLFHAAATAKLTIWTWCPVCGGRTDQDFEREDSIREYYRCQECKQLHGIAVR